MRRILPLGAVGDEFILLEAVTERDRLTPFILKFLGVADFDPLVRLFAGKDRVADSVLAGVIYFRIPLLADERGSKAAYDLIAG